MLTKPISLMWIFLFFTCISTSIQADVPTSNQSADPQKEEITSKEAKAESKEAKAESKEAKAEIAAAVVGKETISRDAILQQISEYRKSNADEFKNFPDSKIFEMVREEMIRMLLLKERADAENITKNPEFVKRQQELVDQLKVRLWMSLQHERFTKMITEEQIKEETKRIVETEKALVFKQMLVSDQKTAEQVKKSLLSGQKFMALAKNYSKDKKETLMDPIPEAMLGSLPSEMQKSFANLKPHQVILFPSKEGIMVMQLVERKKIDDPRILESMARQNLMKKVMQDFLLDLEKKEPIKRYDIEGKEATAPGPSS